MYFFRWPVPALFAACQYSGGIGTFKWPSSRETATIAPYIRANNHVHDYHPHENPESWLRQFRLPISCLIYTIFRAHRGQQKSQQLHWLFLYLLWVSGGLSTRIRP